jgi:hypothetical protein
LSVELHGWPAPPIPLLIPELDASNSTPVTRKVDGARPAAGADIVAHLHFMVAAVLEMDDNAVELNGATLDFKQN